MDREKVIKGLTKLSTLGIPDCAEGSCPFWKVCVDGEGCYFDLFPFALALLKEQEAVKPTWNRGKPFCGACGLRIRGTKYCSECGKPIAWEGQ